MRLIKLQIYFQILIYAQCNKFTLLLQIFLRAAKTRYTYFEMFSIIHIIRICNTSHIFP